MKHNIHLALLVKKILHKTLRKGVHGVIIKDRLINFVYLRQ